MEANSASVSALWVAGWVFNSRHDQTYILHFWIQTEETLSCILSDYNKRYVISFSDRVWKIWCGFSFFPLFLDSGYMKREEEEVIRFWNVNSFWTDLSHRLNLAVSLLFKIRKKAYQAIKSWILLLLLSYFTNYTIKLINSWGET